MYELIFSRNISLPIGYMIPLPLLIIDLGPLSVMLAIFSIDIFMQLPSLYLAPMNPPIYLVVLVYWFVLFLVF